MQRCASEGRKTGLDMGDLQAYANPCNVWIITRNETLG